MPPFLRALLIDYGRGEGLVREVLLRGEMQIIHRFKLEGNGGGSVAKPARFPLKKTSKQGSRSCSMPLMPLDMAKPIMR